MILKFKFLILLNFISIFCFAQFIEITDFSGGKIELKSDSVYLFIVMDHPLCRSCAEQLGNEWGIKKAVYPYRISLLSLQEDDIRNRRLKTSAFKYYFPSDPEVFFLDTKHWDVLNLKVKNQRQFPAILLYIKNKFHYINYDKIFDNYRNLKIKRADIDQLVENLD